MKDKEEKALLITGQEVCDKYRLTERSRFVFKRRYLLQAEKTEEEWKSFMEENWLN